MVDRDRPPAQQLRPTSAGACSTSRRNSLAASDQQGGKAMARPSRLGVEGTAGVVPRRIRAGGGVGAGEELLGQQEQDARAKSPVLASATAPRCRRRSSPPRAASSTAHWPKPWTSATKPMPQASRSSRRRSEVVRRHLASERIAGGGGRTPEDIDVQGHGKRRRLGRAPLLFEL